MDFTSLFPNAQPPKKEEKEEPRPEALWSTEEQASFTKDVLDALPIHTPRTKPEFAHLILEAEVDDLLAPAVQLQKAAGDMGISNVFVDGGYHAAVLCRLFGLQPLPGKRGDDASKDGRTYELKAVNLLDAHGNSRKEPDVGAGSRIQAKTIDRWERETDSWLIGYFQGPTPREVWQLPCSALLPLFSEWRAELRAREEGAVIQPHVPYRLLRDAGKRIYWRPGVGPTP